MLTISFQLFKKLQLFQVYTRNQSAGSGKIVMNNCTFRLLFRNKTKQNKTKQQTNAALVQMKTGYP